MSTRPRTREEIDVALHGIGLAIDELLDGVRVPDPQVTTELPGAPAVPDLQLRLGELIADAEVDARRVEITVDGARITLRGAVEHPLTRLLIEDLAWSLPEVHDCHNDIVVVTAP